MTRHVAICVFYDQDLNIFVQERGSASKVGEKYGFWGGQLEEGETPEQAMRRELEEELGFVPKELKYWGQHSHTITKEGKYKDWIILKEIFLSPVTARLLAAKISEGRGMVKLPIDVVISGEGFTVGGTEFMVGVKHLLKSGHD